MAKNATHKNTPPAKIRFVLLEAELPNGDLSQITQALVNALKQSDGAPTNRRLTVSNNNSTGSESNAETLEEGTHDETDEAEEVIKVTNNKQPRKYKTPTVLDMKLEGDPSFEVFAQSKQLGNHQRKFLAVAAWFKNVKQAESINVDHVYTCYRFMKWQTNFADFSQPLRDLKSLQFLELKGKGQYSITHLGLNQIDKDDAE